MTTQSEPDDDEEARLERIVREGPVGTWAVAGVATLLVMLVYLAFYVLAYLPRGVVQ